MLAPLGGPQSLGDSGGVRVVRVYTGASGRQF